MFKWENWQNTTKNRGIPKMIIRVLCPDNVIRVLCHLKQHRRYGYLMQTAIYYIIINIIAFRHKENICQLT